MKENSLKLVYHYHEGKGFFRDFGNSKVFLANDFNFLSFIGLSYDRIKRVHTMCTKINFMYEEKYPGVAWIDKYGNLIVRINNYFNNPKINF